MDSPERTTRKMRAWLAPHRVLEGDRLSNTILAERLAP
jgi:hypothetical protein